MEMQTLLIRAIAVVGLAWYYVCVVHLGLRPTPKDQQPNGFRQFQALSVTTISVSLSTFVGFVIGIKGTEHVPQFSPLSPEASSASSAASGVGTAQLTAITNSASFADLQWWSAGLYVLSLVLALFFYYRTQDNTEPAITGLAKSLLGFVAGVLSITLNVPSAA